MGVKTGKNILELDTRNIFSGFRHEFPEIGAKTGNIFFGFRHEFPEKKIPVIGAITGNIFFRFG